MKAENGYLIFDSGREVDASEFVIGGDIPPHVGYFVWSDDLGYGDATGYEYKVLSDLSDEEMTDAVDFMIARWQRFKEGE